MIWFPTPEQVKLAGEVYGAIQNREKIESYVKDLYDTIRNGRPTFLIFGPGGNGKSTLRNFLNTLSQEDLPLRYRQSLITEWGKIKGRRFSNTATFPGQIIERDNQIKKYRRWMQGLKRPFITICFSYGYRSIDRHQQGTEIIPQGIAAREEEMTYVYNLLERLRIACSYENYTIFTIILKQDLWWDEKTDVESFYNERYRPIIEAFAGRVGTDNCTHYMFPLSLVRSNLLNAVGQPIKFGSSNFDDIVKDQYKLYFLSTLQDLLRV
jgi:energy-coupling factor transporter ATP-binding protein EcfA2